MPQDSKTKTEINELRMILGTALSSNSLDKDNILRISQDLDKLIMQYYREIEKETREQANML